MLRGWVVAAVLASGAAGLSACNHEQAQDGGVVATIAPAVGFYYLDEGPNAKLAYGQANSDNVGLMLVCAKGSRQVEVSVAGDARGSTLTLASGGARTDLKPRLDPGDGFPVAAAETALSAPALAAFRRSGRIEVAYAGQGRAMAARSQERASVERFFAACEGPRA